MFISYGREDQRYLNDLKDHAADLVRNARVEFFDDTCIQGGREWKALLEEGLGGAEIFMILVTSKSISSDYCMRELDVALALGLMILPVKVGSVLLTEDNPLSRLQYVPNGGAISELPAQGRAPAWRTVVKQLRDLAYGLRSVDLPDHAGEFGKVISLEARRQPPTAPSVTLTTQTGRGGSEVIAVLEATRLSGADWRGLAVSTRELRAVLDQQRTARAIPSRAAALAAELEQTLDSILQPSVRPAAVHRALERCEQLRRWLIDALAEG